MDWTPVTTKPPENARVEVKHCFPSGDILGTAYYDGAYRNAKGGLLDTPSYWRLMVNKQ